MPPVAAAAGTIGSIIGGIGAGAQAAGSIYGAFKGKGGLNNTGVVPVFKDMNKDYLSQLGMGLGPNSLHTLSTMSRTGMPSNVGPMFEALVKSQERFNEQGRKNVLENFGAMGLRYSKPAMDAAVDYESQLNANYGSILANYVFQALESAKQRQLGAATVGQQAYATPALTLSGGQQPGTGLATAGEALSGLGTYISAFRKEAPAPIGTVAAPISI